MLAKEIELEKVKAEHASAIPYSSSKTDVKAKIPKLPPFNEQRDNMDAYLKRFERFAESAGWDHDRWATNLSALLQGTALDVYSRLSSIEAINYEILRESLLKRFQLTEEGFRLKFRKSTPEKGETASQFATRINNYLTRWMDLAKIDETYEGIRDLFLREQFMNSVNKNLQIFLKEHKVKSIAEMAELAEQYHEAHGSFSETNKPKSEVEVDNLSSSNNQTVPRDRDQKAYTTKERFCYFCHSSDHFVRNCPKKMNSRPKTAGLVDRGRGRGSSGWNISGRGQGRYQNESSDWSGKNDRSTDDNSPKSTASCILPEEGTHECCFIDNKVQLKCGHDLPLLSAACKGNNSQWVRNSSTGMPVETWYVGKHRVSVLRDSGCSTAVVKRSLVEPNQFTGNYQHCILIDGTLKKVEVANIYVDTPFYEGQLEGLCMKQPIYDLIIGNTSGVRDPFVENISQLSDSDMAKQTILSNSDQGSSKDTVEVEQGVQMRAPRDKKKGKVEHLIVENQTVDIVDVAQGVQTRAQNEDEGRVQSPKAVYDVAQGVQSKAQKEKEIGNVQSLKVVDQIVATVDVAQSVLTQFQKERDTVKVQYSYVVKQVEDVTELTQDVQMRFQEEKEKGKIKPLEAANQIADITPVKIKEAQNGNETFSVPIRIAESDEKKAVNNGSIPRYVEESSILYREYQSEDVEHGKLFKQSVVPKEYRQHSLRLENDTILSEHLGITQVTDKIQSDSHWPVVQHENIRYYCSSCDVCKRTLFKGKILKVPIIDMPRYV